MISSNARPTLPSAASLLLTISYCLVAACSDKPRGSTPGSPNAEDGGGSSEPKADSSGGGGFSAGGSRSGGGGSQADRDSLVSAGGSGGAEPGKTFPDIEFTYDPSLDVPNRTCANGIYTAGRVALDIYVILDKSGSMLLLQPDDRDCEVVLDEGSINDSRWCRAVTSLGRYFAGDLGQGHRAALNFMTAHWDLKQDQCARGEQNPHSIPVVPYTTLPDLPNGPLITALNDAIPDSLTEFESALNGIIDYTMANITPGRRSVGILITDGAPDGVCENDPTYLGEMVQRHYQATGIPIYFVGISGAAFWLLDDMARAAGAPNHTDYCDATDSSCHYWSVGDGDPGAFAAALESIQHTAGGCTFAVPAQVGKLVDIDTLEISLTDSTETRTLLEEVANQQACGRNNFYLTTNTLTPSIELCPEACALLGESGRIDIAVSCKGE